jgi:hypothetical protein
MAGKEKYGYRGSAPKFFKPDTELKSKVGTGGPDRMVVGEAQRYLDGLQTDIAPQLGSYLMALQIAVDEAGNVATPSPEHTAGLTKPLLDLKATSGMFGHMMLCRVSGLPHSAQLPWYIPPPALVSPAHGAQARRTFPESRK